MAPVNINASMSGKELLCRCLFVLVAIISCNRIPERDAPPVIQTADVHINEIMQSNVDCIMDDLNEFPDSWVELYNSSDVFQSLDGYSLGVSDNLAESYILPATVSLAPHSFFLVFCDKEAKGIHTNFRVDSGKEVLYLFKDGQVVDYINLSKQPAPNIAYGRKTEEGEDWGYQLFPTPGQKNCGQIAKGVLDNPIINCINAISYGGTTVSIDIPNNSPEGTVIRYTIDYSEPTEVSPLYNGSLSFSQSGAIRAKLFCEGYLSQRSITQSVIVPSHKHKLPVMSLITDDRYLYSDSIGIYSNSVYRNDSLNFKYNWRRPANVEYFEENGKEVINQLCETRIHGGYSRLCPLKSMVCYANKRFGVKSFKYSFFPEHRPGVKEQKSFILRNSGTDFNHLYMRDAIIQGLALKYMKLDCQAYSPVAFYMNGDYKGLMYLMERSTDDNIETNYGIKDFDMVENWKELKRGDWLNYNEFVAFYTQEGHTIEEYRKWMDVNEYCDYMILQLFFANRDFPRNNIVMWRPRESGGKWRWIVKDMDFGLGFMTRSDFNVFRWFYGDETAPNDPYIDLPDIKYTILFQNLMKNKDFRDMFISRSVKYIEDFMNSRGVHEIWDSLWERVGEEYMYHREIYVNMGWPIEPYDVVRDYVDKWIEDRPGYYLQHLQEFYGVEINAN